MFNIGDKVKLTTKIIGEADYSDVFDEVGIVRSSIYEDKQEIVLAQFKSMYLRVTANYFKLAETHMLTIAEVQQLKEQLALDLLALIEAYETRTNAHIANMRLQTMRYAHDGVCIDRVTGVRLEVQL